MTLDEIKAAQVVAGERYSAAVAEFRAAFIDLAALDMALANGNSGHNETVATFAPHFPDNAAVFAHPVFAPQHIGRWSDEVRDAADAYIDHFNI
jgi:hypothetical protein